MENEADTAAPQGSRHSHSSLIATLQSSLESPETSANSDWLKQRAYGFAVASCNFLVEQGLYTELLTDFKISPLPNTPDHFLGLTNVRGNLVPVYQVETLFGLAPPIKPAFALLFDHPVKGAAVVIEEKPQSIDMSNMLPIEQGTSLENLPPFLRSTVTQTYSVKDTTWHAIKHTELFRYLAQFI